MTRFCKKDHLDHEEAIRDTVVSVLVSPYFCFRVDPGVVVRTSAGAGSSNPTT